MYRSRFSLLPGTSYAEIEKSARKLHKEIAHRTKRNAYVRSAYFKRDKIFIKTFWEHLHQKPMRDRKRRLKFYACAIDLLRHSTDEPSTKPNPNRKHELVHRFQGCTSDGINFYVQVKEDKRNDRKYFMSCFGSDK